MGHSVGLDNSYFRPTEDKLLLQYSKAINELTINEENRLKKKVTELEQKQSEIDQLKYEHAMEMKGITDQLDRMDSAFAKLDKAIQMSKDIDKQHYNYNYNYNHNHNYKKYGFDPSRQ